MRARAAKIEISREIIENTITHNLSNTSKFAFCAATRRLLMYRNRTRSRLPVTRHKELFEAQICFNESAWKQQQSENRPARCNLLSSHKIKSNVRIGCCCNISPITIHDCERFIGCRAWWGGRRKCKVLQNLEIFSLIKNIWIVKFEFFSPHFTSIVEQFDCSLHGLLKSRSTRFCRRRTEMKRREERLLIVYDSDREGLKFHGHLE